jgi:hypothetical protein
MAWTARWMASWTRFAVSFLAETVVQRGFRIRGDTILIVGVVPTPAVVTGLVRAVKELLGGFVEVVVTLVRNDELDRRSTSDLHSSGLKPSVVTSSGVSWLHSRRLCRRVSVSFPVYSLRASDQLGVLAS